MQVTNAVTKPLLLCAALLLVGCSDGGPSQDQATAPAAQVASTPSGAAAPAARRVRQKNQGDYYSPDLVGRAAALAAQIKAQPTDATTLKPRAWVLWEWANAFAMSGKPIHPDLPAVIGRVTSLPDPVPNRPDIALLASTIDSWINELNFREQNPKAFGVLTSPNRGPFPVDSYQTLEQAYTVGDSKIEVGGGFLVTLYAYGTPMQFQTQDPSGDGYTTIASTNPNVKFVRDEVPMSGMFSGSLRGQDVPRPFFRVVEGTLLPGDTVTIRVGDRSKGSKGFRLPSPSSSGHRVRVWVKLAEGGPTFPMTEVPFLTEGQSTFGVRGWAPSVVGTGESVQILIRSEDQFRNRATSLFPIYSVKANGREIAKIANQNVAINRFNTNFNQPGVYHITIESEDGIIKGEVNPVLVQDTPPLRILWGETHGHSGFAEGIGTVDAYFDFAAEDARFDFVALSEHDIWLDDAEWEALRAGAIKHRRAGQFETFLASEWTVPSAGGGHHNVIFRTPEDRRRADRQRAPKLADLYRLVAEENEANDVLVIPHAHNPGNWWVSDPKLETAVEIVSNHGTFEWLGRRYLASGHHLAFIGGSDDHIGHPGLRALNAQVVGSDNQGGQAAVIAPEKSRDAIFDAIKNRSVYATNGHRIILEVSANGAGQGQRLPSASKVVLNAHTIGTGPIDQIAVVKNGKEVQLTDYGKVAAGISQYAELRFWSQSDPMARGAMARGARTWQGTLRVSGAKVLNAKSPNNDNAFTEVARLSDKDPQLIEFRLRTRGHSRSIALELEGLNANTRFELNARSTGFEDVKHTFAVSALQNGEELIERRVDVFSDSVALRLVEPPTERERSIEYVDEQASDGDNYYVRIVTSNGGMAWSSPVVIGDAATKGDALDNTAATPRPSADGADE